MCLSNAAEYETSWLFEVVSKKGILPIISWPAAKWWCLHPPTPIFTIRPSGLFFSSSTAEVTDFVFSVVMLPPSLEEHCGWVVARATKRCPMPAGTCHVYSVPTASAHQGQHCCWLRHKCKIAYCRLCQTGKHRQWCINCIWPGQAAQLIL